MSRPYLVARTVRVRQHQAWSNDVERGIDVHGVRVLERHRVDLILGTKMTTHPLDPHVVCNLGSTRRFGNKCSLPHT